MKSAERMCDVNPSSTTSVKTLNPCEALKIIFSSYQLYLIGDGAGRERGEMICSKGPAVGLKPRLLR